jgi:hypothetical protein
MDMFQRITKSKHEKDKLLLDGLRMIMQMLIENCHDELTDEFKTEIQQWYDQVQKTVR